MAENHSTAREALCELLNGEGYSAVPVEDGQAALTYLQTNPVPLLLTELKMPCLSGLELLEAIEAQHIPTAVVLLTSHASVDTAVNAMKRGAHDYLTKPVDPQRLLLLIPKALEAQRIREAAHTLRTPTVRSGPGLGRMVGTSPAIKEGGR